MRIKQSAAVVTMLLASTQAIRVHDAPANKNGTAPADAGLVTLEANIEKHHTNKEHELQKKIKDETASVQKMEKKLQSARIELETDETMFLRHKEISSNKDK